MQNSHRIWTSLTFFPCVFFLCIYVFVHFVDLNLLCWCVLSSPHQIDFVAHDDIPYISAGSDDVYKHIKEAGECQSNQEL